MLVRFLIFVFRCCNVRYEINNERDIAKFCKVNILLEGEKKESKRKKAKILDPSKINCKRS